MPPQRLPIVDSDDGVWGDILRQYLMKEHYQTPGDTDDPANGGHQTITVRAGTTGAGTAPITLTSGSLMTAPEAGAIEFNNDRLYFTKTTGPTRQTIASYDTTGSTGDLYHRDASGMFTRIPIGNANELLGVSSGVPAWTSSIPQSVVTNLTTDLAAKSTPRAALLYDPSSKGDGALASNFNADTGQSMTAFTHTTGSSPLTISSGVITHTPYAGGGASAGYMQADLGGRVRRIGAMVSWPTSALGVVALVIPSAAWAQDTLPNAGFHLGINGNGVWSLTRYTTGGSTTLATYATHGRFDSSTWGTGFKPVEIWLSPEDQKCVITWPDGTTATVTSPYFDTETSNYAIWELFESNGVTDVAASLGALWADTAPTTPDISSLITYRSSGQNAPVPMSVSGVVALDLSRGSVFHLTLTGNITSFSFSSPQRNNQEVQIHFIQDGTGSRTLAGAGSSIKWANGTTPTLSTAASARDAFSFRHYNGNYYEIARALATTPVGAPVGTTDTQTLTSKTLSTPAIAGTASVAQSGAISVYNTADQVTNYERTRHYWAGNQYVIGAESGGTGALRQIAILGHGVIRVHPGAQGPTIGTIQIFDSTGGASGTIAGVNGTLSASSGLQYGLSVSPTFNQSSTAGYTTLLINSTETATGNGAKKLIDAQVGGSTRFSVDNTGVATVSAVGTAAGSLVSVDGSQTLTNKTLTTPRINEILDTNGNRSVSLWADTNAVNYFILSNRAAGAPPYFAVDGTDTNINIGFTPKGSGKITIWSASNTPSILGDGPSGNGHFDLQTNGTGVVQANGIEVATTTGTQTLTNKTLGTTTFTGSQSLPLSSKTANYTLTSSDHTVLFDATSAAVTATLPAASGATGRVYVIKKIDSTANTVTVDGNSSETIDGNTTVDLSTQWESITIQSTGSSWVIL